MARKKAEPLKFARNRQVFSYDITGSPDLDGRTLVSIRDELNSLIDELGEAARLEMDTEYGYYDSRETVFKVWWEETETPEAMETRLAKEAERRKKDRQRRAEARKRKEAEEREELVRLARKYPDLLKEN